MAEMTQTQARKALRAAIKASGLSQTKYAELVLLRDRRTISRWLKGDNDIPEKVVRFLAEEPDQAA